MRKSCTCIPLQLVFAIAIAIAIAVVSFALHTNAADPKPIATEEVTDAESRRSPSAAAMLHAAENPRAGEQRLSEAAKETLFTQWLQLHGKTYKAERLPTRFSIWKENLEIVRQHNSGDHSWKMGMTSVADLTLQEFRRFKLGFNPALARPEHEEVEELSVEGPLKVPDSVDWRTAGAVTPVLDQGNCGSCYAFSSNGGIEGAMALAGSQMVPLSQQNVLDCSRRYGNAGCNGGLMTSTFSFVKANGGVCSNANYKYTGRVGTCKTTCKKVAGSALRSYTNVAKNEPAIITAIAQQPLPVAVAAGNSLWQLYRNGVIDSPKCGRNLDHAVLAVGYGSDERNASFIIIKNSWGTAWGEDGYVRLARGKNMCGVNDMATFPNVALALERERISHSHSSASTSIPVAPAHAPVAAPSSRELADDSKQRLISQLRSHRMDQ